MPATAAEWERMWAPYDPATYALVLEQISPPDVVCEIGAGDLRLARQMASCARHVYALEIDPAVLVRGASHGPLPENLSVICADARSAVLPRPITVAVLLMRHCMHFRLYAEKLRAQGCKRLITNARWRMGVEVIDLAMMPIAYETAPMGWYACACGAVGFKAGPAQDWLAEKDGLTHELADCPQCKNLNEQGVYL